VVRQEPDLVCLHEVRPTTRERWARALRGAGLEWIADSGEFRNGRRLFNLTAARWPLRELPAIGAPQPERVLSTVVETRYGLLDLHNAHVPPAQSRGFLKVETCDAPCTATTARRRAGSSIPGHGARPAFGSTTCWRRRASVSSGATTNAIGANRASRITPRSRPCSSRWSSANGAPGFC
jgi:hypothetical protein